MHLRPEIIHEAVRILPAQEHARQRGDTQSLDRFAEEQPALHIHGQIQTGTNHEPVGARHAAAIQQGVDDQRIGILLGLFDPELAEDGEFFSLAQTGIDGQPPGGKAIGLTQPDGAEVTGAQEHGDFVEGVIMLERVVNPDTRETQILG